MSRPADRTSRSSACSPSFWSRRITGSSFSSDATTATPCRPPRLRIRMSLAITSSFCCCSPCTFCSPALPSTSSRRARRTCAAIILADMEMAESIQDRSPAASGNSACCCRMWDWMVTMGRVAHWLIMPDIAGSRWRSNVMEQIPAAWELGEAEISALKLSLEVATRSVCMSLVPAICIAWLLTRRRFPGRMLFDAVVHLPLVLPPVVVGYLLLLLLGTRGPIGGWLDRHFRRAAGIHHAGCGDGHGGDVLSADGARHAHRAGERGRGLEDAARTLGAGPWDRFVTHHAAADAARRACGRCHRFRRGRWANSAP